MYTTANYLKRLPLERGFANEVVARLVGRFFGLLKIPAVIAT
jgi:hypothetical protein